MDPTCSSKTPEGAAAFRKVAEDAIQACGLHVSAGAAVWHDARQYEAEVAAGGGQEGAKALERVRQLYQRQLQVPLEGNDKLMKEYEAWEAEHKVRGMCCGLVWQLGEKEQCGMDAVGSRVVQSEADHDTEACRVVWGMVKHGQTCVTPAGEAGEAWVTMMVNAGSFTCSGKVIESEKAVGQRMYGGTPQHLVVVVLPGWV